MNQRELDDSFSMLQQGLVVWTFSLVRDHTVVRKVSGASNPVPFVKISHGEESTHSPPAELAPDFPSTAAPVYENRSGEADAKLAELWKKKKPREEVAYSAATR